MLNLHYLGMGYMLHDTHNTTAVCTSRTSVLHLMLASSKVERSDTGDVNTRGRNNWARGSNEVPPFPVAVVLPLLPLSGDASNSGNEQESKAPYHPLPDLE